MRRCKCCSRPLPVDSGLQRRYCDPREYPDCKAKRDAYRKAHGRARAYNAYALVVNEAPEGKPKRRTTEPEAEDLDYEGRDLAISSRWDEISKAWQRAKLHEVNRLMEEAEGARSRFAPPTFSGDHSKREDWGSAGELWLRGDVEGAKKKPKKEAEYVLFQCGTESWPRRAA